MFTLIELPYTYNSLEPYISQKTLEFHHDKHLAGYVNKLNELLTPHEFFLNYSIEELIQNIDKLPEIVGGLKQYIYINNNNNDTHLLQPQNAPHEGKAYYYVTKFIFAANRINSGLSKG